MNGNDNFTIDLVGGTGSAVFGSVPPEMVEALMYAYQNHLPIDFNSLVQLSTTIPPMIIDSVEFRTGYIDATTFGSKNKTYLAGRMEVRVEFHQEA